MASSRPERLIGPMLVAKAKVAIGVETRPFSEQDWIWGVSSEDPVRSPTTSLPSLRGSFVSQVHQCPLVTTESGPEIAGGARCTRAVLPRNLLLHGTSGSPDRAGTTRSHLALTEGAWVTVTRRGW